MTDYIDASGFQLIEFNAVSTFPSIGEECSIRLQLRPGYSMLYGKNGAGKTRILSSIKRLCVGIPSSENELVSTAIFKLDYEKSPGYRAHWLADVVKEILDDASGGEDEIVQDLLAVRDNLVAHSGSKFLQDVSLPVSWKNNERTTESDLFVQTDPRSFILLPLLIDIYFMGCLKEISDSEWKMYGNLIESVVKDGYVEFAVDNEDQSPSWTIQILAKCDDADTVQRRLYDQSLRELGESNSIESDFSFSSDAWESGELSCKFFELLIGSELETSPYVSLKTMLTYKSKNFPIAVLDLNTLESAESLLNQELLQSIDSIPAFMELIEEGVPEGCEPLMGSFGEVQILSENNLRSRWKPSDSADFMKDVIGVVDSAAGFIRETGIGLSDGYLSPCITTEALLAGRFFSLQFDDLRGIGSVFPLNYGGLSDAQRRVVDIFVGIAKFKVEYENFLVIGDEVDSSMHPSATVGLHRALSVAVDNALVATHSFDSLSSMNGHRFHISRIGGRISLDMFEGNDLVALSNELGVAPSALLGLVKLFVLVEGEHDRVIVEDLLSGLALTGELWAAECVVIPMRGVNEAWRTIDAQILNYSDANVLVIVDNAGSSRFEELKQRLMSIKAGSDRDQQVRKVRHWFNPRTHEEKVIFELLGSRDSPSDVGRISIFGLEKGDIIEYLSPQDFGLTESWEFYREDFENAKQVVAKVRNFKHFLSNRYGAQISIEVIRKAIQNLDARYPRDFQKLIACIKDLIDFGRLKTILGKLQDPDSSVLDN